MSTQPKPTGEWTATTVREILDALRGRSDIHPHHAIADAHNAALAELRRQLETVTMNTSDIETVEKLREQLADERDKANVRETELICERDYFKKELDAERVNRESIESINKSLARAVERLQQQLRGERCEICNSELSQCGVQGVDGEPSLDCLVCKLRRQLDAEREKVQTLVDALKLLADDGPLVDYRAIARTALAKVGKK